MMDKSKWSTICHKCCWFSLICIEHRIILSCHSCIYREQLNRIESVLYIRTVSHISTKVLPSALWASLRFLTFTQALTVVNTQWRDPFACVPMFWKSNPIYHSDPCHLQPSYGWAEVCRFVSFVKERRPRSHTTTQRYTDKTHTCR